MYSGTVTFSSLDSGTPAFEYTNEVVFDHCREKFDHPNPGGQVTLDPGGDIEQFDFMVLPQEGPGIADVDLIVHLAEGPGQGSIPYSVTLVSPDSMAPEVLLRDFDDDAQLLYDDERFPLQSDFLSNLNPHTSPGQWILRVETQSSAGKPLVLTLFHWQIRLHHDGAANCIP